MFDALALMELGVSTVLCVVYMYMHAMLLLYILYTYER